MILQKYNIFMRIILIKNDRNKTILKNVNYKDTNALILPYN